MPELCFLGRGSAFNVWEDNTAAYIKHGSDLLLLDCGETVFSALVKSGALKGLQHVYAAISHLHSDHCGSLGSLGHYCHFVLNIPLTILVPEGDEEYHDQLARLLCLFGIESSSISFLSDRQWNGISGAVLRYVPTHHSDMKCFSFELSSPAGEAIFYSGDTDTVDTLKNFLANHKKISAIYMDTTDSDTPGQVHLSLNRLANVISPELRSRTWLMHLNGPNVIQMGEALGFRVVERIESSLHPDTKC